MHFALGSIKTIFREEKYFSILGSSFGSSISAGTTFFLMTTGFSTGLSGVHPKRISNRKYADILFKQNPKLTLFLVKIHQCLHLI